MNVSLLPIILSIGILAFSVYKGWKLVELYRRQSASSIWPVIAGEVVSKRITKTMTTKGMMAYFPEISYKYSVMGTVFEKKTRLKGTNSEKGAENAMINVQNTIELRYNPQNPKEHINVLEKINGWDIVQIIVFLALAGYLLVPLFL